MGLLPQFLVLQSHMEISPKASLECGAKHFPYKASSAKCSKTRQCEDCVVLPTLSVNRQCSGPMNGPVRGSWVGWLPGKAKNHHLHFRGQQSSEEG